jgi:DNA processing protein
MTDRECESAPYGQFGTDPVRAARATLAELDYHHPWLANQIASHGPLRALTRLIEQTPPADIALLDDSFPDTITGARLRERATTVLQRAAQADARILIPEDEQWPTQLPALGLGTDTVNDALLCLWVGGEMLPSLPGLLRRAVAVTGARAATAYGVHVAEHLGHDLAAAGWTVASTGQSGIDAAALRGALSAGGTALAVVPSGLGQNQPARHDSLHHPHVRRGVVVMSPWPLGTASSRQRFAATATVLATATAGTVLVEATLRSQALVTVRRATELGRAVMVVPGPVTSSWSNGTHQVLRDQPSAHLVRGSSDVLDDLTATLIPATDGD